MRGGHCGICGSESPRVRGCPAIEFRVDSERTVSAQPLRHLRPHRGAAGSVGFAMSESHWAARTGDPSESHWGPVRDALGTRQSRTGLLALRTHQSHWGPGRSSGRRFSSQLRAGLPASCFSNLTFLACPHCNVHAKHTQGNAACMLCPRQQFQRHMGLSCSVGLPGQHRLSKRTGANSQDNRLGG